MLTYIRKYYSGRCRFAWLALMAIPLLPACQVSNPSYSESMDTMVMDIPVEQQKPKSSFKKYFLTPGDELDLFFSFPAGIVDENFTIAVNHKVEVRFLTAPELNQLQNVRPDGMISMPYIGQVKALGKTVEELTTELHRRYTSVLRDPELYVVLSEFSNKSEELKNDIRSSDLGLSRKLRVRPDGIVTFPYVGELPVAGRTLTDVNDELNVRYDNVLVGLTVNLGLDEQAGSIMYVLGEVNNPGSYRIQKPVTALEAISLAGGYKPSAKLEQVVALRRTTEQVLAQRVDLIKALTLQDEQFFLQPDDVIFVPKTDLYARADVATQIANILFFRGWGFNYSWSEDR